MHVDYEITCKIIDFRNYMGGRLGGKRKRLNVVYEELKLS